ncbi:uncharacterized protein LOC143231641 [Tachypleus tridentatus]|uniref:uncharacterized protein LOC143231641 n=1 Tax=Tachypleus tridentatus TaxID=6853 RepID=UPI003FD31440
MLSSRILCTIYVSALTLFISSCTSTEIKEAKNSDDSILHFTHRNPLPMKRTGDHRNIQTPMTRIQSKEYHEYALLRCGNIFLRVTRLVHFLKDHHLYQVKCSLRQAFFKCIRNYRERPRMDLMQVMSNNLQKFRKRLADSLWSTRSCVVSQK